MATFEKQDTLDKIVGLVSDKLSVDQDKVSHASTFQDLGADSLDMVEIVMKLEEQFGIEINDEDAEKMTGLDDVVSYVHDRRTK